MSTETLKSWTFVIIQALLLFTLVLLPSSEKPLPDILYIIGLIAQLFGLVIVAISLYDLRKSLTALPSPKNNGELQINGLYKYVRHPMYTGLLILCFGIAVVSGSLIKYIIIIGLWILFNTKARYEEQLLIHKYPGYKSYMKRTPRFLPLTRRS